MTELTSREKITKHCQIEKEQGRRGDVLVYGKHRYRMSRNLATLTDAECDKVFKLMELDAFIAKGLAQAAKRRGSAKPAVIVEAKLCGCGCGRMAKRGSRFLPGHDMKLKSRLRKLAHTKDAAATAELKALGWE